jgi:gamma-D-glutamyl-L-lysine dipeptidyl-peptidase
MNSGHLRNLTVCLGIASASFFRPFAFAADPLPIVPSASDAGYFVVAVPAADLRDEPRSAEEAAASKKIQVRDLAQQSQLLFGEVVQVLEQRGPWARVQAVEQPEYSFHGFWEGFPGWVRRDALLPRPDDYRPNAVVVKKYSSLCIVPSSTQSAVQLPLGSRVTVVAEDSQWARVRWPGRADGWIRLDELRRDRDFPTKDADLRMSILKTAGALLTESYAKGGLTAYRANADYATGFDSAGLVYLAFRVNGVDVPREAHEQFMRSERGSPQRAARDAVFRRRSGDRSHGGVVFRPRRRA